MRNLYRDTLLILIGSFLVHFSFSQQSIVAKDSNGIKWKYSNSYSISLSGGADFPLSNGNNLTYVNYSMNYMYSISAGYYWNTIGLGIDIDKMKNTTNNKYPTSNLFYNGVLLNTLITGKTNVERTFIGIGPGLRFQNKKKNILFEVSGRIGLGSVKGGSNNVYVDSVYGIKTLNYNAGYNNTVLSTQAKAGLVFLFSKNIGINLGAYYLIHLKVLESVRNGYSDLYRNYISSNGNNIIQNSMSIRETPCNCNYQSYGVYGGISYFLPSKRIKDKKKIQEPILQNKNMQSNGMGKTISVIALDNITGEPLPQVDIRLVNSSGEVVKIATTNHLGVGIFEGIKEDDYIINAKLYNIDFTNEKILKGEMINNDVVLKKMHFSRNGFIIQGIATDCNSSQPLSNTNIFAESSKSGYISSTYTDKNGNFVLYLNEDEKYKIHARKLNYYSKVEEINTTSLNRTKSLFFKFVLCAQDASCGNSIRLYNIYYDLDKATLRPEAFFELQQLITFLNDNPTSKVEISSHTDSRGSAMYNLTLSQERAISVVNYLIKNGIDAKRLIARGYGKTRPVNNCVDDVVCTEEQYQQNRRTEMKIICDNQ